MYQRTRRCPRRNRCRRVFLVGKYRINCASCPRQEGTVTLKLARYFELYFFSALVLLSPLFIYSFLRLFLFVVKFRRAVLQAISIMTHGQIYVTPSFILYPQVSGIFLFFSGPFPLSARYFYLLSFSLPRSGPVGLLREFFFFFTFFPFLRNVSVSFLYSVIFLLKFHFYSSARFRRRAAPQSKK